MKFKLLLASSLLLTACSTANKNITQNQFDKSKMTLKVSDWGVSGISSGAMMSAQMAISHSTEISKVGLFSSSIYGCSQGDVQSALKICMAGTDKINEKKSLEYTKKKKVPDEIDSLDNIKKQRVFLFHGKQDKVVKFDVLAKNEYFYTNLKATTKAQSMDNLGHSFATNNSSGAACETSISPYINNCQYDSIDAFFKFIYPDKSVATSSTDKQKLYSWNIENIIGSEKLNKAHLSKEVYIYIPKSCENNTCSAHLALHGCHQAPEFVGMDFIEKAGYLEAAEKYKAILIFPSILKTVNNPYGCWDWWGYAEANNFDTKKAPQIEVLYQIMKQL